MAKKKQTDNEIIDELVAAVTPEETSVVEEVAVVEEPVVIEEPVAAPAPEVHQVKEPGMYHNGRRIVAVTSRLGKKWTVLFEDGREKVLKSEIEFVA